MTVTFTPDNASLAKNSYTGSGVSTPEICDLIGKDREFITRLASNIFQAWEDMDRRAQIDEGLQIDDAEFTLALPKNIDGVQEVVKIEVGLHRGRRRVKIFVRAASSEPSYEDVIDVCKNYRIPSIIGFFSSPESDEKLAKIVSQIRAIPRPWKALCTVYLTVKGSGADRQNQRPRVILGKAAIEFKKVLPALNPDFMKKDGFNDSLGKDVRAEASFPPPKRRKVSSKSGPWL